MRSLGHGTAGSQPDVLKHHHFAELFHPFSHHHHQPYQPPPPPVAAPPVAQLSEIARRWIETQAAAAQAAQATQVQGQSVASSELPFLAVEL